MEQKSANQLYKESNTSLTFKEWIAREKDKGIFIKNQLLDEITAPVVESESNLAKVKFDLGIPKWVIYSGVSIIALAFIYNKYKK